MMVHTKHLLKMVTEIHTLLHEAMVVEVPMNLPVIKDALLPLVVDVIVIMVHPVVVMMVLQIIFMEQAQKAPPPVSRREGKDKTNKIYILYKTNLNTA